jgi:hypothetical protein
MIPPEADSTQNCFLQRLSQSRNGFLLDLIYVGMIAPRLKIFKPPKSQIFYFIRQGFKLVADP